MSKPSRHRKSFFVHIPKTAGTSFRTMLEAYFPGKQIFPAKVDRLQSEHLGYPNRKAYFEIREKDIEQIQLFAGHLPFALGASVYPDLQMLTFLRRPEERFISHVKYIHKKRVEKNKNQSLEETYEELKYSLNNLQLRYLADFKGDSLTYFKNPKTIDEKALAQAKENLMKCAFFGISEQFTASIVLAERTLGWKLGRIRRVNQTRAYFQELPPFILHEMREAILYEKALYAFAVEQFEQRQKQSKSYVFLRSIRPY